MSDDGYKGGSESSNIAVTVSTNVNKDEIDTSESKPDGDKTSIQDLIIDEKKKKLWKEVVL